MVMKSNAKNNQKQSIRERPNNFKKWRIRSNRFVTKIEPAFFGGKRSAAPFSAQETDHASVTFCTAVLNK